MNRSIFVTGLPTTGKTTVCALLAAAHPEISISHIGSYIYERCRLAYPDATYEDLRLRPEKYASPDIVAAACRAMADVADALPDSSVHVFESHAVTVFDAGIRMTPFMPATLQRLAPAHIVLLDMSYAEACRRELRARGPWTEERFEAARSIQEQVATSYACMVGATLFVLPGEETPEALRSTIERLTLGQPAS